MYQKTIIDNGIRVVSEFIPSKTVSVGIWIDVGSRDECLGESGCAHFVEHMLFKGTQHLDAVDIAKEFDRLGGMSNAFTSKETTCLYGTVLDSQFPQLFHLLTDIFLNSTFKNDEAQREQKVILQEIGMVEDTPEDLVHDLFSEAVWKGHSVSNSVLGKPGVISAINSQTLHDFIKNFYTPDRIIIAVAGNVAHQEIIGLLTRALADGRSLGPSVQSLKEGLRTAPPLLPPKILVHQKAIEQAHVLVGCYCPPVNSPERYSLGLLNVILGGNMSSRLFQEIREKRGLAYSIYSFIDARSDSGTLAIYAGIDPDSVNETVEVIAAVLEEICTKGIVSDELNRAKDYARAGLFLGSESVEFRMTRLAQSEMYFDQFFSIDQVDAAMTEVSVDDVTRVANEILIKQPLSGVVLGPVQGCSFSHERVQEESS